MLVFLFVPEKMKKLVLTQKQMFLTSQGCEEHPFAVRNKYNKCCSLRFKCLNVYFTLYSTGVFCVILLYISIIFGIVSIIFGLTVSITQPCSAETAFSILNSDTHSFMRLVLLTKKSWPNLTCKHDWINKTKNVSNFLNMNFLDYEFDQKCEL